MERVLEFAFIHLLSESEYIELYRIVSDPGVASWLSDGRPWTREKLLSLRNWSASDVACPWSARSYFYWAILTSGVSPVRHVIGIVGLHPALPAVGAGLQIMVAVAPSERGHGIAGRAIDHVMTQEQVTKDARKIYAMIREDNAPSQNAFAKNRHFARADRTVQLRAGGPRYIIFDAVRT
jgi:RimJ/RimL family protein N-acetyltransferase